MHLLITVTEPPSVVAGGQRTQQRQRHLGAEEQHPQPQHDRRRVPCTAGLPQEHQVRGQEGLNRLQTEVRHHPEALTCLPTCPCDSPGLIVLSWPCHKLLAVLRAFPSIHALCEFEGSYHSVL